MLVLTQPVLVLLTGLCSVRASRVEDHAARFPWVLDPVTQGWIGPTPGGNDKQQYEEDAHDQLEGSLHRSQGPGSVGSDPFNDDAVLNNLEHPVTSATSGGKIDPVADFRHALIQLKQTISETEALLVSAMSICKAQNDCSTNRQVLEVRGRMRRLQVAMHNVAQLKPVAFMIRNEAHNSSIQLQNSTDKLTAASISLNSVMMSREAVKAKLSSLQKLEARWRQDMKKMAKSVLETQHKREAAERKAQEVEQRRLQFLTQLNAVLEGVAVGDQAAELTYEEAEDTLMKAKGREVKAKKEIMEAERLLDKAYAKQRENQEPNPNRQTADWQPILQKTEQGYTNEELSDFGDGESPDQPLPLVPNVPQTLLAHKRHHLRTRMHHMVHHGAHYRPHRAFGHAGRHVRRARRRLRRREV